MCYSPVQFKQKKENKKFAKHKNRPVLKFVFYADDKNKPKIDK